MSGTRFDRPGSNDLAKSCLGYVIGLSPMGPDLVEFLIVVSCCHHSLWIGQTILRHNLIIITT